MLRLCTVNSVEEKIIATARFKLNVDEKVRHTVLAVGWDRVHCTCTSMCKLYMYMYILLKKMYTLGGKKTKRKCRKCIYTCPEITGFSGILYMYSVLVHVFPTS